jgi:TonB family protein
MQINNVTKSGVAVLVLASAFPSIGVAQDSSANLVAASPPFLLTDAAIKPNTKGLDVESLISTALRKAPPVKSEFETNADFEERTRKFGEAVFSGRFTDRKVAIIHPVSSFPLLWRGGNQTTEVTYSAETEVMSVRLHSWVMCGVPLKRTVTPKRSYTASNNFGRKVEVIVADEAETCLELDGGGDLKIDDLTLTFSIPKKEAPTVRKSLSLIVIGRLSPPYATSNSRRESPTMTNPVEIKKVTRSLVLKPDDVWVVDSSTGHVLAKEKAYFMNSEASLAGGLRGGACDYPRYSKRELPNYNLVVELEFAIGSDGTVQNGSIRKSTGIEHLDNRALKSIGKCRFKPAMRDGTPVEGLATVKFNFSQNYASDSHGSFLPPQ